MKKKISEAAGELEGIVGMHRNVAYDALTDILFDALCDVSAWLNAYGDDEAVEWEVDRQVCGFSREQLVKVLSGTDEGKIRLMLAEMPEFERLSLIMSFLNWDSLRIQNFRSRYPNSFMKWSPEDDEALMEMYSAGKSWRALSDRFGRNINAVKLRLQHLGVDLGAEAGRPRFNQHRPRAARPLGAATTQAPEVLQGQDPVRDQSAV